VIREAQRQFNPKVEPSIDQLVVDYMGAVPPLPVGAVSSSGDVVIAPEPRPQAVPLAPVQLPPSNATPGQ
jgi:general secretion pathway protein D